MNSRCKWFSLLFNLNKDVIVAFSPDMLRTIHLIATTGSFVLTAQLLNKVPSAISYNVKKWEEELGFIIFDRKNKQIKLTPAGQFYIEQTKWLLDAYDSLLRKSNIISHQSDITFTIAINNIINQQGLPNLINFMTTSFPATQFTIIEEVYNGTWDALYSKKADLVVGAPHTAPKMEGIICEPLGKLEWDFVIGNLHPLSQTNGLLTANILRQYPAVVVKDTAINLPKLDTWSLAGQQIIYVHNLETAIALIEQGTGIGYIPHHKIKEKLNNGQLIKKAIEEHKLPTQLYYAWRTDSQSKLMQYCTNYIISQNLIFNWHG